MTVTTTDTEAAHAMRTGLRSIAGARVAGRRERIGIDHPFGGMWTAGES